MFPVLVLHLTIHGGRLGKATVLLSWSRILRLVQISELRRGFTVIAERLAFDIGATNVSWDDKT